MKISASKNALLHSNSKKINMAQKYHFFDAKILYFHFSVTLSVFREIADYTVKKITVFYLQVTKVFVKSKEK